MEGMERGLRASDLFFVLMVAERESLASQLLVLSFFSTNLLSVRKPPAIAAQFKNTRSLSTHAEKPIFILFTARAAPRPSPLYYR